TGEAPNFDERKSIVKRGDTVAQIVEENPHRVLDLVPVYDAPDLHQLVPGVKAVVLEPTSAATKSKMYYPTTNEYHAGSLVTWDWNTRNSFGPMWYMGTKGQAVKAWDRSFDFAGKEIVG